MNNHSRGIVAGVAFSLLLTGLIFAAPLSMTQSFTALQNIGLTKMIGTAEAVTPAAATFDLTDEPGPWFDSGVDIAGTRSLAIVGKNDVVRFTIAGNTDTVHTVTSLVFPTGAKGMPFDQPAAFRGTTEVKLKDAGLYVFVCKIHPFMLGAVIVDDEKTPELDLGTSITLVNGVTVPTASDLSLRLVRAFFVITNPGNWQTYDETAPTWDPNYPPVSVLGYDANNNTVSIPDLNAFMQDYFDEPTVLTPEGAPLTDGIGEVWVDTQYEKTTGKTKPGTATAVNATTWEVKKKVALDMNNPHNMWTNEDQSLIYQTEWFSNELTVFDRATGAFVRSIEVGESPAHVMTRTDTDQVHVSLNGEDAVVELSPGALAIDRRILVQNAGENPAQPHAHWMGFDGQTMVTPNSNTADSTLIDVPTGTIDSKLATGTLPIATGLMPDSSKYYVSNYVDSTISVIDISNEPETVDSTINLLANYVNPQGLAPPYCGLLAVPCTAIVGPVGALPIQTPVSPNGEYVITANTLTGSITIIDTGSDTLVKSLPCDAGCHGVNFGAKEGGGYYAYVSSKFSNRLIIVDPDPNNDGNPIDAFIAGDVVLNSDPGTVSDETVLAYEGMGGQGVLPIPLVYNGWVQNLPNTFKDQLTDEQKDPIG